jgi:hypothetical protein
MRFDLRSQRSQYRSRAALPYVAPFGADGDIGATVVGEVFVTDGARRKRRNTDTIGGAVLVAGGDRGAVGVEKGVAVGGGVRPAEPDRWSTLPSGRWCRRNP